LKPRRLTFVVIWACLAVYLPAMVPGVAVSPLFCMKTGGDVTAETGRGNHCPLPPGSAAHDCCSHPHGASDGLVGKCHCGPCLDIPIPVEHVVAPSDGLPGPAVSGSAVCRRTPVLDLSPAESGLEYAPPESCPTLLSIRTTVLLI
jgi:hypothetical protein